MRHKTVLKNALQWIFRRWCATEFGHETPEPQIHLPDVQFSFPNNPEIFLCKQQNIHMEVQFPR